MQLLQIYQNTQNLQKCNYYTNIVPYRVSFECRQLQLIED